jgi:penicillin-binding protein 2
MRVVADESRGAIVDRNGVRLVQAQAQTWVAAKPTPAAGLALRSLLSDQRFAQAKERLAKGNLLVLPAADPLPNCKDLLRLEVFPRYAARQPAAHLIGYLDGQTGVGVSGLEKAFEPLLGGVGAGELAVRLAADANHRALAGAVIETEITNYRSPAGVRLTLDSRVQRIVEDAMEAAGLTQGAVVVLDCQTGEVLAMASSPSFNPNNIAASLKDPLEPFYNRALGACPVGSMFKCFVAAAALEQRILPETQFTCKGELNVNGQVFHCQKQKAHGTFNMTQALEESCNLYFIQLAAKLERQPLLDLLRLFGFGEETILAPGIVGSAGNLPTETELRTPGQLANFAFGQGKLLSTPLQISAALAVIANGGVYRSPTLVQAAMDETGQATTYVQDSETREVLSPKIAAQVRKMMISAVENGPGRSAKPELGGAGGKTATAQSGQFGAGGSERMQTGFTGFFPAKNPRYVITVTRQNGSSGAADCCPVFRKIANAMRAQGLLRGD